METRVGLLQELDPFACPLHGLRLIEASAGTGKTWNICGLYLRLLLEKGLTVQQLLVVTFTKAATAELRERLRARLVDALNGLRGASQGVAAHDPFVRQLIITVTAQSGLSIEILAERVQTALHCFDEAAIFTIHSFCQRALADTPFAAGMPFSLELMQDDHLLCHEAVADFWRRHIASQEISPALADWLVARQDTPETWTGLLKKMLAKSQSRVIWPEEDTNVGLHTSAQATELNEAYRRARAVWGDGLAATRALLDGIAALNATSYKPDSVAQAAQSWREWFAADDPLATVEADKRELFSAAMLQKRCKKNQSAPRHAFFDLAAELLQLQQAQIDYLNRARLHLLRRMLEETGRDLLRRKREQRCVSFDDMLFNMHRALSCGDYPWLAAAIRSAYPVALIDEFQDTDPLQFQIFSLLYPPDGLTDAQASYGPIFLVGDPKQAIYSFRNADLHTYLHAKSLSASPYTLIHNQRSSPTLIAACNALFARNPQAFILDGLNYADVHVGAKPRTAFIDRSTDGDVTAGLHLWYLPDEATRSEAMQQVLQATAAEVARLIAAGQKVGAGETDGEGCIRLGARGLAPGDIAILVKSHRQGRAVKQALLRLGIASVELSHNSIFDSNEAREMQVLLHAILEPTRPDRLYAALATELLGFSADRIDALAADENALLQTLQRFADYREIWTQRGFGSLMREFMNREAMPQRLLAYQDGERRLTNLLHLGELLQAASQQHPAAEALLRWLNACRREGAQDEVAQLRLESDRNLVQIVTIHKSKGLEYPVVFCPFLFDGHSRPMGRGEFREYHDQNHAPVLDFRPESAEDEEIKRQRLRERDAEDMRLIYVALTRAVHRAYLVAGCYSSRNTVTESARSLLNWMAAGGAIGYDEWKSHKLGATEIRCAWQALAQNASESLRLIDLPQRPAPPVELPHLHADQLQALPAPKRIPIAWRIGSFSHLHHGSRADGIGSDHDGHVGGHIGSPAAPIKTAPPAALADDDILHFPRGPSAGDCLHAIFERIDFGNPASFDAAIERALLGFAADETAAAPLAAMLRRMLNDVLATPLRPGLRLQTIAPQRRLIELEFHLPTPRLDARTLNAWLAAHRYPLAPLDFYPLSGYLKGYVDLIFEHDGRFYILDWKSNHLGYTAADYGPAALAMAMSEHGYHLQYLLYAVALHRFLRQRLRDYDYRQHFGGVLYLFVRGVRPEWADSGVYFHLPELATLESLDGLLAGKS